MSNRCSQCDVSWPTYERYKRCPLCGGETWRADMTSITDMRAAEIIREEQDRLASYSKFEQYYADREVAVFREQLDSQALLEFTELPTK